MLNGSHHVFYNKSSRPVIRYPAKLLSPFKDQTTAIEHTQPIQNLNEDLAVAWCVMKRFCLLIDLGQQTQRQIRPEVVYETMMAVIYRLLDMDFVAGSTDETIRRGLLAFCYHVFLQWRDIKPPHCYFSVAYRDCLRSAELIDGLPPQLIVWLLMTAANSVFRIEAEPWLAQLLRKFIARCKIGTWKEMQEILKSYMWITLLDERPGEHIYDLLQSDEETKLYDSQQI